MDNSRFLCMHRVRVALSQVKGLVMGAAGGGIHSISTAYAQVRGCCAQVVHMFVHRQHAGHEDLPRGLEEIARDGTTGVLPVRIRQGPSMYEMEGPRPASLRQGPPVAWLRWCRAPPAGARRPCKGPVSRLLPRFRGRPRGGARFQR